MIPLQRAKMLLFVALSSGALAAQGPAVIGVGDITSSIRGADPASFQVMLETQLSKTNKFKIIERNRLDVIFKEVVLRDSGLSSGTGPKLSGVDYLIYGTISKLGTSSSRTIVSGLDVSSDLTVMAVDLRLVDAGTGEIKLSEAVSEQIKSGGRFATRGFTTGSSAADPLADVQRLTAKAIAALITTRIYPVKVIDQSSPREFVVNYGDSVLTVGDRLRLFKQGKILKDPDTGRIIGNSETEIGILLVTEVTPTMAKVRLEAGTAEVGSQARRLPSTAAPPSEPVRNGPRLPIN